MKREIKFRAWIPTGAGTGDMVQPSTLQEMIYSKSNTFPMAMLKRIDFMQYTGLHDKNGQEIYESDILKVTGEDGESYAAPVKWFGDDEYPAFDLDHVPKEFDYDANVLATIQAYDETCEVIGNIWENPELVEDNDGKTN